MCQNPHTQLSAFPPQRQRRGMRCIHFNVTLSPIKVFWEWGGGAILDVIALGTHSLYNSAHPWKTSPQFFFLTSYCFGLGLHRASRFLHPGSAPFRSSGLLKEFIYLFFAFIHMYMCQSAVYVQVAREARRGHGTTFSHPQNLKLQVVVDCWTRVLGTQHRTDEGQQGSRWSHLPSLPFSFFFHWSIILVHIYGGDDLICDNCIMVKYGNLNFHPWLFVICCQNLQLSLSSL